MLFGSKLPVAALVQWCRALKHGLDIGLPLAKIFKQQAKSGPAPARQLAETIAARLAKGQSLAEATRPERERFPTLFVELVAVGEATGRLTETFTILEDYFDTVQKARKQFIAALIYPGLMYFSAIAVVALMLLILGMLAPSGGKGFDPLGLGLLGPKGALIFLTAAAMFTASWVGLFLYLQGNDRLRAKAEALALGLPGLQGCFRAFALQRFSIALNMAGESGLRADEALRLSLRATANDAYRGHAEAVGKLARGGREITPTLAGLGTKLFPAEYLDAVQVGEVTGQLPEVMAKQAAFYRDESARKLKFLTGLAGGLVYAMVGLMIIVVIFKMAMSIGGIYDDALKGT